jgi:hypothetical protein
MPRRLLLRNALLPRRLRRGTFTASGSGFNALAFVTPPAGSYVNNGGGAGATVRLVDGNGVPLTIPGVLVTAALPLGSAADIYLNPAQAPAQATTDASGVATFPTFDLIGIADTYSITFTAPGFLSLTQSGVVLVAGGALQGASGADVPAGTVGQPTTIQVHLRDFSGNELQVAAPLPVDVAVSGANARARVVVPYASGVGYLYNYTPTVAGTDSIAVRYNAVAIAGSPYTSLVTQGQPGLTQNSLRVGMWAAQELIGKGPHVTAGNWDTQAPLYTVVMDNWSTTASINAAIAAADAKNVLLIMLMPGNKASYGDPSGSILVYNDTEFRANIDRWAGNATLIDALARRRVLILLIDEPWIAQTVTYYTPLVVRNMARYVKTVFPNSLISARMEPNYIRDGWGGQHGTNILPANYFDKIDYMWATYRAFRTPTTGMTPLQWVQYSRPFNSAAGYGTIFGSNWWNLGDGRCWDYLNTGASNGRIVGDSGGGPTPIACATQTAATFWQFSPAEYREMLAAVLSDQPAAPTDVAPLWLLWTHAGFDSGLSGAPNVRPFEQRSDTVAVLQEIINGGNARSTTFQWRTPK